MYWDVYNNVLAQKRATVQERATYAHPQDHVTQTARDCGVDFPHLIHLSSEVS